MTRPVFNFCIRTQQVRGSENKGELACFEMCQYYALRESPGACSPLPLKSLLCKEGVKEERLTGMVGS